MTSSTDLTSPDTRPPKEDLMTPSIDLTRWLDTIPDRALLSRIGMPGTHETMARFGYGSVCQDWTLEKQLKNGLRVFDIRVRYYEFDDGKVNFAIHHSNDYQQAFLDSQFPHDDDTKYFVFDDCLEFLKANPSETVVLLIKQEKSEQVRQTFFDAFWKIVEKRNGYNGKTLDDLFYAGKSVPRLSDARGRIVLAFVDGDDGSDYELSNPARGLYWGNMDYQVVWNDLKPGQQPGLDVENHWRDLMDSKWDKIEAHLAKTNDAPPSVATWYLTFTSASRAEMAGHLPKDYADYLLPKVDALLVKESRRDPQRPWGAYFGTLMMDFPTSAIIEQTILAAQNFQYPL